MKCLPMAMDKYLKSRCVPTIIKSGTSCASRAGNDKAVSRNAGHLSVVDCRRGRSTSNHAKSSRVEGNRIKHLKAEARSSC